MGNPEAPRPRRLLPQAKRRVGRLRQTEARDRMIRRCQRAVLIVAALAALFTVGSAGATDLVLCIGPDGHRALEAEHSAMRCSRLWSSASDAMRFSAAPAGQRLATCRDLPVVDATPAVLSFVDEDWGSNAPDAGLAPSPSLQPVALARHADPSATRTAHPPIARHLRTTILLV